MDPPTIGAHCNYEHCHNHDFLPTKCLACNNLYCRDHYFRDAHDCEAVAPTDNTNTPSVKRASTPSCAFKGCLRPCLESYVAEDVGEGGRVPAPCSRCSFSFCAHHRFLASHVCKGSVPPEPLKNEAARALLAKNFPALNMERKGDSLPSSSDPYPKKRQRPQRTTLVQLMKMRQSAVAGDPKVDHTDLLDRLHVQVKFNRSNVYKPFWFRKSISTGRAFDLLQQRLEASPHKSWILLKEFHEADKPPAPLSSFDRPLSEEFEDGCKLLLIPSV